MFSEVIVMRTVQLIRFENTRAYVDRFCGYVLSREDKIVGMEIWVKTPLTTIRLPL